MGVKFIDDINVTGAVTVSSTLTLSSIGAAGEETVSALFEESGVIKKADLGTNAFTSTTIPTNNNQITNGAGYITSLSGAVLTSGNQTVAGAKTFSSDVVTTSGADGGMRMGGWPYDTTGFSFIGTTNMSGLEYCMLSDGTNTFLGAGSGGALKMRGPANDSSPSIVIDGSSVTVDDGASTGEGAIRAKYKSSDNSAGITTTVGVKNASQSSNLTLTIKDGIIVGVS